MTTPLGQPSEAPPTDDLVGPDDPAFAGQAAYTPFFLARVYDPLVVRFANRFGWRCSSRVLRTHYDCNVSGRHLDIGPGTGWFLDRCRFPSDRPSLTLLDCNDDVLSAAGRRLARYRPENVRADILRPFRFETDGFDSVGMVHVLHCLPGTIVDKAIAIDNAKSVLRPGGRLFGSTILAEGVVHSRFSRGYLDYMNEMHVFDNLGDSLADLRTVLADRFTDYEVHIRGRVALFSATA